MALTQEQFDTLGPEVLPFDRRIGKGFMGIVKDGKAVLEEGEAILFDDFVHNVTVSGLPMSIFRVEVDDIVTNSPLLEKYLWIIDKSGLKIIRESTPNPKAEKKGVVCHTNITGGQHALQGGELWFGQDNRVYVNNKSGRYGANTTVQEEAVIAYFVSLGLEAVQLPF